MELAHPPFPLLPTIDNRRIAWASLIALCSVHFHHAYRYRYLFIKDSLDYRPLFQDHAKVLLQNCKTNNRFVTHYHKRVTHFKLLFLRKFVRFFKWFSNVTVFFLFLRREKTKISKLFSWVRTQIRDMFEWICIWVKGI